MGTIGTEKVFDYGVGTAIEEWWRDCEMMEYTYGGRTLTVRDYYPAFDRALQSYARALRNDTGGDVASYDRARGFTLLFGPGDYYFSQTPTLMRGMYLLGQGAHGQSAFGTRFRYANGIDGLHARFRDTPATPPTSEPPPGGEAPPRSPIGGGQGRSEYSVVENIAFVGNAANSRENHGIWALAPIRISNCIITNWGGNGIRMTSTLEGDQWTSSTNHSLVEHCTVQECGWRGIARATKESWEPHFCDDYYDGIYVKGANSNGSLFSAVHCTGNGRWGFYDESQLGCTFVACMTHGNGIVREVLGTGSMTSHNLPDGGGYKVFLTSARSVFIGCYTESDQRPAEVSPLTLVFGGAMSVDRHQGQWFRTDTSRLLQLDAGVTVWNRNRGHETVKGTLGTAHGSAGVAFEAVNVGKTTENPGPLNLKYDEYGDPATAKTWSWRHDAANVMVIGVDTLNRDGKVGSQMSEGAIGHSQVYFPGGILLGHSNVPEILLKNDLRSGGRQGNIQGITKTQFVRIRDSGPSEKRTFFEGYASNPPSAGNWNDGDRLWNINPQPGQWMGWVCTESGIPGTWRAFGTIV
jgi:hypothetical protein